MDESRSLFTPMEVSELRECKFLSEFSHRREILKPAPQGDGQVDSKIEFRVAPAMRHLDMMPYIANSLGSGSCQQSDYEERASQELPQSWKAQHSQPDGQVGSQT